MAAGIRGKIRIAGAAVALQVAVAIGHAANLDIGRARPIQRPLRQGRRLGKQLGIVPRTRRSGRIHAVRLVVQHVLAGRGTRLNLPDDGGGIGCDRVVRIDGDFIQTDAAAVGHVLQGAGVVGGYGHDEVFGADLEAIGAFNALVGGCNAFHERGAHRDVGGGHHEGVAGDARSVDRDGFEHVAGGGRGGDRHRRAFLGFGHIGRDRAVLDAGGHAHAVGDGRGGDGHGDRHGVIAFGVGGGEGEGEGAGGGGSEGKIAVVLVEAVVVGGGGGRGEGEGRSGRAGSSDIEINVGAAEGGGVGGLLDEDGRGGIAFGGCDGHVGGEGAFVAIRINGTDRVAVFGAGGEAGEGLGGAGDGEGGAVDVFPGVGGTGDDHVVKGAVHGFGEVEAELGGARGKIDFVGVGALGDGHGFDCRPGTVDETGDGEGTSRTAVAVGPELEFGAAAELGADGVVAGAVELDGGGTCAIVAGAGVGAGAGEGPAGGVGEVGLKNGSGAPGRGGGGNLPLDIEFVVVGIGDSAPGGGEGGGIRDGRRRGDFGGVGADHGGGGAYPAEFDGAEDGGVGALGGEIGTAVIPAESAIGDTTVIGDFPAFIGVGIAVVVSVAGLCVAGAVPPSPREGAEEYSALHAPATVFGSQPGTCIVIATVQGTFIIFSGGDPADFGGGKFFLDSFDATGTELGTVFVHDGGDASCQIKT